MIKSRQEKKVKDATNLVCVMIAVFGASICTSNTLFAQENLKKMEEQEYGLGNENGSPNRSEELDEESRAIDAEEFRVQLKRRSTSGRVLLLDDPTENRPRPGKILLLKDDKENIVAIRVLKNYIGKFAAKIVLPFGPVPGVDREYRALKKIGDKLMESIRREELKRAGETLTDEELAREVAPDDQELDRGIPKPTTPKAAPMVSPMAPKKANKMPEPLFTKSGDEISISDIVVNEDDDLEWQELSVQESSRVEQFRHSLSIQYAGIKNVDQSEALTSYNGIGLRYAYNIGQKLLLKHATTDVLTAEIGAFYYKIAAFRESVDELTIVPLVLTGRYGLLLGQNFHLYGYAGLMFNNVTGSQNVDLSTTSIDQPRGAFGVGLNVRVGPAWALRGDFGTDMFGVGAVLKF